MHFINSTYHLCKSYTYKGATVIWGTRRSYQIKMDKISKIMFWRTTHVSLQIIKTENKFSLMYKIFTFKKLIILYYIFGKEIIKCFEGKKSNITCYQDFKFLSVKRILHNIWHFVNTQQIQIMLFCIRLASIILKSEKRCPGFFFIQ